MLSAGPTGILPSRGTAVPLQAGCGLWVVPPGGHLPRQGVWGSQLLEALHESSCGVSAQRSPVGVRLRLVVSCTLKTAPHHLRSASPSPLRALLPPGAGLEPSYPCPSAAGRVALSSHPRPLAPPRGRAAPPAPRGEARRCGRAEHSTAAQSTAQQQRPHGQHGLRSHAPAEVRGSHPRSGGAGLRAQGARCFIGEPGGGRPCGDRGSGPGVRRLPAGSALAWEARQRGLVCSSRDCFVSAVPRHASPQHQLPAPTCAGMCPCHSIAGGLQRAWKWHGTNPGVRLHGPRTESLLFIYSLLLLQFSKLRMPPYPYCVGANTYLYVIRETINNSVCLFSTTAVLLQQKLGSCCLFGRSKIRTEIAVQTVTVVM